MAQVTLPYTLTAGTPENVNNLMSNLTALRDGVNTIDTAQIAAAAVTSAKLASGAVDTTALGANAVTSAKLATALADNLSLDNGSNIRRASVTATTERTTTSGSATDVTGASVTLTIPSNSVVFVCLSAELKNSGGSIVGARVLANTAPVADHGRSTNTPSLITTTATAYQALSNMGSIHSALTGTGSQTLKVQFISDGTNTTSIKNVYLTAFALTY